MANSQTEPTASMSVEAIRERLFKGVEIAPEMLNEALKVTRKKLSAKVTKFGYYKGEVVSRVNVEDHSTQLAAADQIYSIAGVYSRERDKIDRMPTIALEINPVTGVMKVIVGVPQAQLPPRQEEIPQLTNGDTQLGLFVDSDSTNSSSVVTNEREIEEEPEIIKMDKSTTTMPGGSGKPGGKTVEDEKPNNIPEYIWRMLNSK